MKPHLSLRFAAPLAAALVAGCSMDQVPDGLKRTPPGAGPTVRFDLAHTPLPDVPIPNDVATWPDPTSRTGLRLNTRMFAPTSIEADARARLDRLEGWGTFGAITLAFDKNPDLGDAPAIDLDAVRKRHQRDDYDFQNDAIYLVDLETGVPVPLDLGEGSFSYILRDLDRYWRNDTRATEENTLWETYDETYGLPEGAVYDPKLDTDFDGVLDRPNLDDPKACPAAQAVAGDPAKQLARQQCVADHLLTWYERETDTLILRPLVPLHEMHRYAVVLTDRLVDPKGRPVKSPFDFVYHPSQEQGIARLQAAMSDPARAAYWGDLGASGLDHVSFAWTFTTQPTTEDMRLLRDGLYGQGPFAYLAERFPAKTSLERATGLYTKADVAASGGEEPPIEDQANKPACVGKTGNLFLVKIDQVPDLLQQVVEQVFGLTGLEETALLDSWKQLDYIAIGTYKSPFFVEGGPKGTDPHAAFHLNMQTGEGEVDEDVVPYWLLVPKQTAQHKQPFPVALYGHGYTGNSTEGFLYAGTMARLGVATMGIDAVGHGLTFDANTAKVAKALFAGACLAPLLDDMLLGRARDLNGDGVADSGGDFWTSYLFHTRDVVRQSVLDHMQLTRILRTFDGRAGDVDYDHDGVPEKAGDFDANGTPDIGGPNVPLATWGQSLGAFLSSAQGGIDHQIQAAAPTAGGAMIDVGLRTFQGGVVEAVTLRLLGPLVVDAPASGFQKDGKIDRTETQCAEGEMSLRFVVPDLNDAREVEFGCVPAATLPASHATVVMRNLDNGEVRCARVGEQGLFRLGVPTSVGDRLSLEVYGDADAVLDYKSCAVRAGAPLTTTIGTWGKGPIAQATPDPVNADVIQCPDAASCTRFQKMYFAEGGALTAPADGYGFSRQSPSLRGFMGLAQHILDPADGITYMPHYGLDPLPDPYGNPGKPRGLLDIQTIGDMNVPISAGISYGRAAGALPFFTAQQAASYPEWADYATPSALLSDFGGVTPNRLLIDHHVVEGIRRLRRTPAGPACSRNWTPDLGNQLCNPPQPAGCKSDPANVHCKGGYACGDDDQCHPAADPQTCAETLYDPDALAEGKQLFDAQSPTSPLRLARIATRATPATVDACTSSGSCASPWAPRLLGKPLTGEDADAWKPNAPVIGQLDAMVEARGVHCFENPSPCKSWDESLYLAMIVTQFFRTSGQDLYYLSHPKTHHCMQSLTCPELAGE